MSTDMHEFATVSINSMLDQVLFHLAQAVKSHDEEPVHRLRVSIRRLQQGFRLFGQYVNAREVKRLRKQLRKVLHGAAEVRNRDVTIRLLRKLHAPEAVVVQLERERRDHMRSLQALLKRVYRRAGKWHGRLGLG